MDTSKIGIRWGFGLLMALILVTVGSMSAVAAVLLHRNLPFDPTTDYGVFLEGESSCGPAVNQYPTVPYKLPISVVPGTGGRPTAVNTYATVNLTNIRTGNINGDFPLRNLVFEWDVTDASDNLPAGDYTLWLSLATNSGTNSLQYTLEVGPDTSNLRTVVHKGRLNPGLLPWKLGWKEEQKFTLQTADKLVRLTFQVNAQRFFLDSVYLQGRLRRLQQVIPNNLRSKIPQASPSASTSMPIRNWAVWGPGWGQGGLGVAHYNREGNLHPQPGDLDFSLAQRGRGMIAWRRYETPTGLLDFLSEDFPLVVESMTKDRSYKWAGATEYAHTYLWVPALTQVHLDIESPQPYVVWLNGHLTKKKSGILWLDAGWNSLMIKSIGPSKLRGIVPVIATARRTSNWYLRANLTGLSKPVLDKLKISAYDPQRRPVITDDAQPLRYLSTITRPDGDNPLFIQDHPIVLNYRLRVSTGPAPDYLRAKSPGRFGGWPWQYSVDPQMLVELYRNGAESRADGQPVLSCKRVPAESWISAAPSHVHVNIVDYEDAKTIFSRTFDLSYREDNKGEIEASLEINLGRLPVGNYILISTLLNEDGTVQARDNDHSFSVLWGPVDQSRDTGPRYLATVGHWLAVHPGVQRRLRWLHRVGITRQQKLDQSWSGWGVSYNGKGEVIVKDNPVIDDLLKEAKKLNIMVVGDLTEGFIISQTVKNGNFPPINIEEQKELRRKGIKITDPGQLILVPVGARPLPPYGTKLFEKILHNYAYQVVLRYKGRIKYWGGSNEIDLHNGSGTAMVAKVYTAAARIIYQAMKEADPEAQYISPSLVRKSEFTEEMMKFGFLKTCDIVDVHAHPAHAPDVWDESIGNTPREGLGVVLKYMQTHGIRKPVWYGETSAPLAISPRAVQGQAEAVVKQLVWAMYNPYVEDLSYLVVYDGPEYGDNQGFDNMYGDPLPVVNAVNVASHLLDGRKRLADLKGLPAGVQYIHVDGFDGLETVVLWSRKPVMVTLTPRSKQVILIDLFGRSKDKLSRDSDGKIRLLVDETPQYLRGRF